MIFVTIGFQLPFDRLIKAMDEITPKLHNTKVIAQVSKTEYKVQNMEALDFVLPTEFNRYFEDSKLIVSHAGMGTILSALENGRPIVVMPRLKKYNEVNTDHQLATAKSFEKLNYIHVAYDENELQEKIVEVMNGDLKPLHTISKYASDQLINSISRFISEVTK